MSSNEQKVLKAVDQLGDREKAERLIGSLDELFELVIRSEKFSESDGESRVRLFGTYRHLREFLSQISSP